MSVYKEGYYALNQLQNNQRQIWPDACDFGTPVEKKSNLWNLAKQLVDWYGIYKEQISKTETVVIVSLMDEWKASDDESPNRHLKDYNEYYKITYISCKINKVFDGFFTVDKIVDKNLIKQYKELSEKRYSTS